MTIVLQHAALAARSIGLLLVAVPCCSAAIWVFADEPQGAEAAVGAPDTTVNPYSPLADLTPEQLEKYLDKLLAKPETIRARPGFREAVLETAERILSADTAQLRAESLEQAVLAQFDILAQFARDGDRPRIKALQEASEKYRDDSRPAVAAAAQLRRLECRVLYGDPIDVDLAPELLAELKSYFEQTSLAADHLRLASASVGLINLLPDRDQAQKLYAEFGGLFAKSTDKKLARYGKNVVGGEASEESFVGKPLELEGNTVAGTPFDWSTYRGKIVLVDFWATWCGPCRAELPHVKQAYDRFHDAGFEVVAISLDQDREALETYLADEQIPWENLFEESSKGRHPLAEKYHIRGIPSTFLVGRDGKVVAQNLRGAGLSQALEKLFSAESAAPAR